MKPQKVSARKLLDMTERLEEVKIELAKLDGLLEELLKRLKVKSGESNLKRAKAVLIAVRKKLEKKENELEDGVERLEEKYEWQ